MTAESAVCLVAAFQLIAAAGSVIIPSSSPIDITAESRLLGLCVAGSTIGAFLAVWLLPADQSNTTRKLSGHFAASAFAGLGFSPMVIEKLGWVQTGSSVLGVSAAIALFGVLIIGTITPRIPAIASGLLRLLSRK